MSLCLHQTHFFPRPKLPALSSLVLSLVLLVFGVHIIVILLLILCRCPCTFICFLLLLFCSPSSSPLCFPSIFLSRALRKRISLSLPGVGMIFFRCVEAFGGGPDGGLAPLMAGGLAPLMAGGLTPLTDGGLTPLTVEGGLWGMAGAIGALGGGCR